MTRSGFGHLFRKRGGPKWYARVTLPDGRRLDRALSVSKEVSRQVLADWEAKIAKQEFLGLVAVERIRFEEFAKEFLKMAEKVQTPATFRSTRNRVEAVLVPTFRARWLDEVGRADVERFVNTRAEGGVSVATRNRDLCVLSALYRKAVALGRARENPASGVPRPREEEREVPILDLATQDLLVSVCPPAIRALVLVALRTGLRQSELLALAWGSVDFTRKVIRVPKAKNKEPREVPLTSDVERVLRSIGAEQAGQLFGGGEPATEPASRLSRVFAHLAEKWTGELQRLWKTATSAAKLGPTFRFHDLRHVALSTMVANGLPLTALMRVSGHRSLAAVQRYLHFAPGAAADAARGILEGALTRRR